LNVLPEDIVLEHDHGTIARAKIDTWIPSLNGRSYAIEFKYDRPIPSERNLPLTQKAGHLIKDLFGLRRSILHSDLIAFSCVWRQAQWSDI
jgi:hypothetical protein